MAADAAVPVHWNAAGEVDGYAGRLFALGVPVLIGAGLLVLLVLLPRLVAGWAFVIGGLAMVAAGVLAPASMTVGAVGVDAAALSLGVVAYSYVVWRSAPDRDGHGTAG